ncbi:hypothetical protein AZF37_00465 [endosymbiont 'TC1' of Trimyema compressum]|nr:hypothetical protein AZF37_00465 [endosymbiont 'TC1' of Trimyema compressum]
MIFNFLINNFLCLYNIYGGNNDKNKEKIICFFSLLMSVCISFYCTNYTNAADAIATVNFTNSYSPSPDPKEADWAVYVDPKINLNLTTPFATSKIELVGANNLPLSAYSNLNIAVKLQSWVIQKI